MIQLAPYASDEPMSYVIIGNPAPQFVARTTAGEKSLSNYRGRWLVFFSHPADFTHDEFRGLGCELLALSVDSLSSHIAWIRSKKDRFDVAIAFPLIEDPSMAIARAYGMLPRVPRTVRATFVIDPDGIIRAISWYPMSTGRSVAEILRLVDALQTSDADAVSTPEGWRSGDPVSDAAPLSIEDAMSHEPTQNSPDWYFRMRTQD